MRLNGSSVVVLRRACQHERFVAGANGLGRVGAGWCPARRLHPKRPNGSCSARAARPTALVMSGAVVALFAVRARPRYCCAGLGHQCQVCEKSHSRRLVCLALRIAPSTQKIPTAKRYVLTCGNSQLARPARSDVTQLTSAEVFVLQGGTQAWLEAALPLSRAKQAWPPRADRYRRPYEGTDSPQAAKQAYLDCEFGLVAQFECVQFTNLCPPRVHLYARSKADLSHYLPIYPQLI